MNTEDEVIIRLKQAMNYVGETECCASCKNFMNKIDGSMVFGGPQMEPRGERCGLNVIEIPINCAGRCNHFQKREPLVQLSKIESL